MASSNTNNVNSGAAADLQPGTSIPVGPTRGQPATTNQKQFARDLGVESELSPNATKGQASDVISANLNSQRQTNGSGAAEDTTPGSKVPTGPSAEQDATRNQKAFIGRLGQEGALSDTTTKGEASEIISSSLDAGDRSSGAAPDTTPGNQVPTGPSRNQPATNKQKNLLDSLGASDQLGSNASKGEASDIISSSLGNGSGSTGGSGASSGAAPDTNPGNQVPSGPSRNQPATNKQKGLLNSLGSADQLTPNGSKGEASDIISGQLNNKN